MVVHIGAHRTGSTMVSQSIEATIAAHPDCGVVLWGARYLRAIPGFPATNKRLDDDAEPVNRAAAVALDALASFLAREMAVLRAQGVKTLILSEENFIGHMRNNFKTGTFYGDVERRLGAHDSLLPMSPNRIALGVRDYGAVWSSAYHYVPQSGRPVPPIEKARATMFESERGWPDVAADTQGIWPDAELIMWQQEHLDADCALICARIMGIDKELVVMPEGRVNARKPRTPKPNVFSPDEQKQLSNRYRRHLRLMRGAGNSTWVGEAAP